jgi:hypothetical protein
MNPKIGLSKNEKMDFSAREYKLFPTFSLDKLVNGTRFIMQNIFFE